VIHRDLKPANVMLGAFGEVQVMDWGLAKRLGERPASGQLSSCSDGPGSSALTTHAGTLMGTPAYTPPEQASGAVEQLDERSDVFGLGAILCEILTGQPPYVGRDEFRVRGMAARAELVSAEARLRDCGADAELVGLTLVCLAPKPADRPRDARAVAEALTAHLDGVQARLRKAELAEAAARARAAEEAKRRRLTLALAATVLLAVALGGGAARWLQADRQARQAQVAREVHDALDQVTALREQARAATTDGPALLARAREQAQRALALVQAGPADGALAALVERVQGELDAEEKDRQFLAAIDNARLGQVETVAPWAPGGPGSSRFATERALPLFREAFRAYGLTVGEGEPAAAAPGAQGRERGPGRLDPPGDPPPAPGPRAAPRLATCPGGRGGRGGSAGDSCGLPGAGPRQTAGGPGAAGGNGRRAPAARAYAGEPGTTPAGRRIAGQRDPADAARPAAVPGGLLGEPDAGDCI
jgi:serine/threonine-protein kinase